MQFIDKTLNQNAGNLLVSNFLNVRWDILTSRYSSIHYRKKKKLNRHFKNILRQPLKQLLLKEQNNLCCYCMRHLRNDATTTFEHVVPKSTNTLLELNKYTHVAIINTNVCLQSVFDNATAKQNTPPFPLEIAYENLTASCKGDFPDGPTYHICNHYRKDKVIEPLFYFPTINSDMQYRKAGLLISIDSKYDQSIVNLNLNYDSLERIRHVWYHISAENLIDIENATTETERNNILTVNLIKVPPPKRMQLISDFKTETFWHILLDYKWFHQYYLTNYPLAAR
jgi:hypothetical protein